MKYLVEVYSYSGDVSEVARTLDYDAALIVFDIRKKTKVSEVHLYKVVKGRKILLKIMDKVRKPSRERF